MGFFWWAGQCWATAALVWIHASVFVNEWISPLWLWQNMQYFWNMFFICTCCRVLICVLLFVPHVSLQNFPQVFCWIQIRQHTCSSQCCQILNFCLTLKAFFNHYHAGISLDCLLHMFCTHIASYHISAPWPDITIMSAQGDSTLSVLKKNILLSDQRMLWWCSSDFQERWFSKRFSVGETFHCNHCCDRHFSSLSIWNLFISL